MLIEGIVVGVGVLAAISKMSTRSRIWMLSRPVFMDILIFILLCLLHSGSAEGMLVAAIGAAACSAALSLGRRVYGHRDPKTHAYVRGFFDVSAQLT